MKSIAIVLFLILVISFATALTIPDAETDFDVVKGPDSPASHEWLQNENEAYNYTSVSQWTITNNYTRPIQMDFITSIAGGTVDDTNMAFWVYKDVLANGQLNSGIDILLAGGSYQTDNGTRQISVNYGGAADTVDDGETIHLIVVHKAPINFYARGDTSYHILSTIDATVPSTGEVFTKTLGSKSYKSGVATITYPPNEYFIKVKSTLGEASWIRSTPYADGEAYRDNLVTADDFGFIAYTDCGEEIKTEGYEGYDNVLANEVIGQTFESNSENVTGIALRMRGGSGDDIVTVSLYDNDPDGDLISSKLRTLNVSNLSKWYFFELESCAADCGNGAIDAGEQCDGENLAETPCQDLDGFFSGELACDASCQFETTTCNDMAGDLEWGCNYLGQEGADYACTGLNEPYGTSYVSGGYLFDDACNLDLSGCSDVADPVCGNDIIEGDEVCDGSSLPLTACQDLGFYAGNPTCNADCTVNPAECMTLPNFLEYLCLTIGAPEEGYVPCTNFNNGADVNYIDGNFYFDDACNVDLSECVSPGDIVDGEVISVEAAPDQVCGNTIAEGTESCDSGDLRSNTCQTLGHETGILACNDFCTFNTSNCNSESDTPPSGDPTGPVCGNGLIELGEACDGTNLNNLTCKNFDYDIGVLLCDPTCSYNTNYCVKINESGVAASTGSTYNNTSPDANLGDSTQTELGKVGEDYTLLIIATIVIILIIAGAAYYLTKNKPKVKKTKIKK